MVGKGSEKRTPLFTSSHFTSCTFFFNNLSQVASNNKPTMSLCPFFEAQERGACGENEDS